MIDSFQFSEHRRTPISQTRGRNVKHPSQHPLTGKADYLAGHQARLPSGASCGAKPRALASAAKRRACCKPLVVSRYMCLGGRPGSASSQRVSSAVTILFSAGGTEERWHKLQIAGLFDCDCDL